MLQKSLSKNQQKQFSQVMALTDSYGIEKIACPVG